MSITRRDIQSAERRRSKTAETKEKGWVSKASGRPRGPGQEWAPPWDRLSEALKSFLAAGFLSPEAEKLICRSLVDGKIRYRWRAFTDDQVLSGLPPATATQIRQGLRDDPAAWRGQMEQLYPRQFMGTTLHVTSSPQPDDFDWRESCFKKPWNFGSTVAPDRHRVWIDLLREDVASVLSDGDWLRDSRKEANEL